MRLYVLVAWLFMFQFVISLLVVCRSHSTEMAERIALLAMDKHLNDNVPKTKQFDSNENASDRERWKQTHRQKSAYKKNTSTTKRRKVLKFKEANEQCLMFVYHFLIERTFSHLCSWLFSLSTLLLLPLLVVVYRHFYHVLFFSLPST